MQNRFIVESEYVNKQYMIKIAIIFQGELESARGFPVSLVLLVILGETLKLFEVGFITSVLKYLTKTSY
jgi:hypothetical protein